MTIDSLTPGTKYWRVTSEQGASSPDTPDFAGLPAVTAPSATGTFTVSTAPPTPVSLAFEGFPSPQVVPGGTNFYLMALQLTAAAPTVGGTISLTSSNPAVAPVPATVSMAGFAWGRNPDDARRGHGPDARDGHRHAQRRLDHGPVHRAAGDADVNLGLAARGQRRLPGGPVGESARPGPRRRGRGEPLEQLPAVVVPPTMTVPAGLLVRVHPVDDDEP